MRRNVSQQPWLNSQFVRHSLCFWIYWPQTSCLDESLTFTLITLSALWTLLQHFSALLPNLHSGNFVIIMRSGILFFIKSRNDKTLKIRLNDFHLFCAVLWKSTRVGWYLSSNDLCRVSFCSTLLFLFVHVETLDVVIKSQLFCRCTFLVAPLLPTASEDEKLPNNELKKTLPDSYLPVTRPVSSSQQLYFLRVVSEFLRVTRRTRLTSFRGWSWWGKNNNG